MKKGSRGLTSIYNLKITDSGYGRLSGRQSGQFYPLGIDSNTVIIRTEHIRFTADGIPDSLVYLDPLRQKDTDIAFQKADFPCSVKIRQNLTGDISKIGNIFSIFTGLLQAGNRPVIILFKINGNLFPFSGPDKGVDSLNIPDNLADF